MHTLLPQAETSFQQRPSFRQVLKKQKSFGITFRLLALLILFIVNAGFKPIAFVTGQKDGSKALLSTIAAAPICGTLSVGPTGDFNSLTAAFLALNGNGLCGPLVFELQNTYVSTVETFPLIYSFTGGSATNTVTIRPHSLATGLSITSAAAQTLSINGGKFLILDGRPGGSGTTKDLTIANTSISGVAIQFTNDATNNSVQFCQVKGVNTSTTSGVITFTSTAPATGNSNNTIANNNISDGATTPTNLIYSSGASASIPNIGNTISANNLFNFFFATSNSNGILLSNTGNSAWTITDNNIYQTVATRTYTSSGNTHTGINIGTGVNYTISGNTIGGQGTPAGPGNGILSMTGTIATRFVGIQAAFTAGGAVSSIQGNIVRRISLNTSSGATAGNGILSGIYISSGNANIGTITGNTIGEPSVTGSLTATPTTNLGVMIGISSASNNTVTISNNTIAGLTAVGTTGAVAANIVGILASSGTNTITNNTIGSTTIANSLNASAASTGAQTVRGIVHSGSSATITGNLIANLNNNSAATTNIAQTIGINTTAGVNTIGGNGALEGNIIRDLSNRATAANTSGSSAVIGISSTSTISTTSGQQIIGNQIFGLNSTAPTGTGMNVVGVFYTGPTANAANGPHLIARNFIHSLNLTTTTTTSASFMTGIMVSGTADAQNNFVRLGIDAAGAAITREYEITGILKATTNSNNIYHNSIYIGGAGVGSNARSTYAFRRTGTGATDALRNNILVNMRSNAAAGGNHYTVQLNNATTLTSSNNIYYTASNTNFLAAIGATDYTALSTYAAAASDGNSKNADPKFINPTGDATTLDLHINPTTPTVVEGNGVLIASVTDDYDGQIRANLTPTDIGADAGNFTPLGSDVGVSALTSPASSQICYTSSETVAVLVRNQNSTDLVLSQSDVLTVSGTITSTAPGFTTITLPTQTYDSGTIPGNGTFPVTFAGTYDLSAPGTYTFNISATVTGDGDATNDLLPATPAGNNTRTVEPLNAGTATTSSANLCGTASTTTLNLTGNTGGPFVWQSSTDNVTFTDIPGATSSPFTPSALAQTTYFRALATCNGISVPSNVVTVTVTNPTITATNTPVTRCGSGEVTLTASSTPSSTPFYYTAATGGTSFASGSSATVNVTGNTTYYVAARDNGPTTFTAGLSNSTGSGTSAGTTTTNFALGFNVTQAGTLVSVDVFPTAAGTSSIQLYSVATGNPGAGAAVGSALVTRAFTAAE